MVQPHAVDELGLAGEVDMSVARGGAGGDQRLAVEGVGTDGGDDDAGRLAATLASAAGSAASATTSSGMGAAGRGGGEASGGGLELRQLRPTSAQRSPAGALAARYSAVSPPVNPVAPNSARS